MVYIDDLGREVQIRDIPQRIVSLVPSITELISDLDFLDKIIGRTNYCIYPEKIIDNIDTLGGTKDFSLEKIRILKPDLIIAVKEENNKKLVLEIAKEYPTIVFDIVDYSSAIKMIKDIGSILDAKILTEQLIKDIEEKRSILLQRFNKLKRSCYLIWNNPKMSISKHTFISEMMNLAGFGNVFAENNDNYPIISEKDLALKNPEFILLSSEPFKFTEKHRKEYQNRFLNSKVVLVDGEMFSWYGSRMLKAFDYFLMKFD